MPSVATQISQLRLLRFCKRKEIFLYNWIETPGNFGKGAEKVPCTLFLGQGVL